jgi:hypothetical protein
MSKIFISELKKDFIKMCEISSGNKNLILKEIFVFKFLIQKDEKLNLKVVQGDLNLMLDDQLRLNII